MLYAVGWLWYWAAIYFDIIQLSSYYQLDGYSKEDSEAPWRSQILSLRNSILLFKYVIPTE